MSRRSFLFISSRITMLANGYSDGHIWIRVKIGEGPTNQWYGPFVSLAIAQTYMPSYVTGFGLPGWRTFRSAAYQVEAGIRTWNLPVHRWDLAVQDWTDAETYNEGIRLGIGQTWKTQKDTRPTDGVLGDTFAGYFPEDYDAVTLPDIFPLSPPGARFGILSTDPVFGTTAISDGAPTDLNDPFFGGNVWYIAGDFAYPSNGSNVGSIPPNGISDDSVAFTCKAQVARPFTPLADDDGISVGNFLVGCELRMAEVFRTAGVIYQADIRPAGDPNPTIPFPVAEPYITLYSFHSTESDLASIKAYKPPPPYQSGGFNNDPFGWNTTGAGNSPIYAPFDVVSDVAMWHGYHANTTQTGGSIVTDTKGTIPVIPAVSGIADKRICQPFSQITCRWKYRAVYISRTVANSVKAIGIGGALTFSAWAYSETFRYCPGVNKAAGVTSASASVTGLTAVTGTPALSYISDYSTERTGIFYPRGREATGTQYEPVDSLRIAWSDVPNAIGYRYHLLRDYIAPGGTGSAIVYGAGTSGNIHEDVPTEGCSYVIQFRVDGDFAKWKNGSTSKNISTVAEAYSDANRGATYFTNEFLPAVPIAQFAINGTFPYTTESGTNESEATVPAEPYEKRQVCKGKIHVWIVTDATQQKAVYQQPPGITLQSAELEGGARVKFAYYSPRSVYLTEAGDPPIPSYPDDGYRFAGFGGFDRISGSYTDPLFCRGPYTLYINSDDDYFYDAGSSGHTLNDYERNNTLPIISTVALFNPDAPFGIFTDNSGQNIQVYKRAQLKSNTY